MPSEAVKTAQALLDIVGNIDNVDAFVADVTADQFLDDIKTYYAALRALEIISEASRKLPDDLQDRHAEIPWRAIRDAGNLYRHDYLKVSEATVWATIVNNLPPLRAAAVAELEALGFGEMVAKKR
jgi:uncharacterized protein with HEPN domain